MAQDYGLETLRNETSPLKLYYQRKHVVPVSFTIARDVIHVSQFLPSEAFEANGMGILEKFFDIGCSLADILFVQRNRMPIF